MKKQQIIELAEDFLDNNEAPDWEVNLVDQFASVYADVTEEGKCLVVYLNNLSGDIEDAQIFNSEEEAEAHLNTLAAEAYGDEEAIND